MRTLLLLLTRRWVHTARAVGVLSPWLHFWPASCLTFPEQCVAHAPLPPSLQDAIEQAYAQDVSGQAAAAVRTYRTALDVLQVQTRGSEK